MAGFGAEDATVNENQEAVVYLWVVSLHGRVTLLKERGELAGAGPAGGVFRSTICRHPDSTFLHLSSSLKLRMAGPVLRGNYFFSSCLWDAF